MSKRNELNAGATERAPLNTARSEATSAKHVTLLSKIELGTVRVGIIGLGYVGLPLARAFAAHRVAVLGFDLDAVKVAKLQRGQSYIGHISDGTIRQMRENQFEATSSFDRIDEPDVIIICVPTPLTDAREPDLTYIISSAQAIAARLRPGQLIVLESTTYPGTTREVVLPILSAGGLKPGEDFFLAFSPEREDPGNPDFSAPTIPKVVGGFGGGQSGAGSCTLRKGGRPGRARLMS